MIQLTLSLISRSADYQDELGWAAAWLYQATGDDTYLQEAEANRVTGAGWGDSWDDKTTYTNVSRWILFSKHFSAVVDGLLVKSRFRFRPNVRSPLYTTALYTLPVVKASKCWHVLQCDFCLFARFLVLSAPTFDFVVVFYYCYWPCDIDIDHLTPCCFTFRARFCYTSSHARTSIKQTWNRHSRTGCPEESFPTPLEVWPTGCSGAPSDTLVRMLWTTSRDSEIILSFCTTCTWFRWRSEEHKYGFGKHFLDIAGTDKTYISKPDRRWQIPRPLVDTAYKGSFWHIPYVYRLCS